MNQTAAADLRESRGDRSAGDIAATYKAPEVEGALDLLFYRRVGFRVAQFFAARAVSPAQVTFLATMIGIAAGHLYVYEALWLNVIGMLLHVGANLLDNVDGQLARLTGRQSEEGRVLDGIGDNLVFASVYAHLCIRYVHGGGSEIVWLVALGAGVCHSFQSSAAEFCRDMYAYFASGRGTTLYDARQLRARQRDLRWTRNPVKKLLVTLHANYAAQQELVLPRLAELRDRAEPTDSLSAAYRDSNQSLVRHARLLGTNTRMLVLFLLLFLRQPVWYFFAELTAFNAGLLWLIIRQNAIAAQLLGLVPQRVAD